MLVLSILSLIWAVQHAAYLMNTYSSGRDGRTAYGRLQGVETKERSCQLGENKLWFAPKRLRRTIDQRYRHDIFLGRAIGSDQHAVGLTNGDVIRARAIVRRIPPARWYRRLALALKTTRLQGVQDTLMASMDMNNRTSMSTLTMGTQDPLHRSFAGLASHSRILRTVGLQPSVHVVLVTKIACTSEHVSVTTPGCVVDGFTTVC